MSFQENLKTVRKQRGLSQEALAAQLHVVRQTVSKWEKGLSVPDAQMLIRLSEILEVPVSTLLGGEEMPAPETDESRIAQQLAQINEQLAIKNRRAQGDISKLENGSANPSLRTLQRLATGLNMQLKVEFLPN